MNLFWLGKPSTPTSTSNNCSGFITKFVVLHLPRRVLLLNDNARPHVAFATLQKIEQLRWAQTSPNPFHLLLGDDGIDGPTNAITYPSRAKKSVQNQWAKQKKPIILGWAGLYLYHELFVYMTNGELNNSSCDCVFTYNTNFESSASAVLFHVRQSFKPLPKNRRPEQLYAMMSIESPYWCYEKMEYVPDDYFNVSITYHSASTIPVPYGQLTQITALTSPEQIWSAAEISERMSRKKRFALQIVSHCGAPSGRDVLTKQLQELIELDMVGKCSGKNCDEQKCYQQQMESHFFYLAFENTVCSEYVTEKFWNALRSLTVPVVLCREVVRESGIPDDLYIAADDFDSAAALADHLKALHKDRDRYLGYFNWTKFYQKRWVPTVNTSAFCQLCEMVHQQMEEGGELVGRNYTVKSHKKLWGAQRCRENFVQNELFKKKLTKDDKDS
ncbi:hypothetical protein niasHT_036176 [Heterodera trifolii]|uniref:Fucosyltransferase n=1 Tax=Heterodera trifolii TaxID=157864 RepID=A0ABD2IIE7_9BILA